VLCGVSVVGLVPAAGTGVAGVCVAVCATAGMVRQILSNHAMEAVTARAFMENSSPERFLTVLNPIMRRLAWTSGSVALSLARKFLSMKGRFLRPLYAEFQLSTRPIANPNRATAFS